MFYMVNSFETLHEHVVDIYVHSFANEFDKHLINQFLISDFGILRAKEHYLVTIIAFVSNERVFSSLAECIHKTQQVMLYIRIDKLIYPWGREKLSFGKTYFRIEKSMHTIHLPLCFFTRIGLESHFV